MKTNPNDMAFPLIDGSGAPGLTKREYFAAMALQGICSSYVDINGWDARLAANDAINAAFFLIEKLNKNDK